MACAAVALVLGMLSAEAPGQTLYKYRDATGHWVYSDRHPVSPVAADAGRDYSQARPGIVLRERVSTEGATTLVAVNDFAAWAQIAYRVEASRNLDPDARTSGNSLLPPGSETPLMTLTPIDAATPAEVSFRYQYVLGHPGASHRPEEPYRLPFALEQAHRVSQAFPDGLTHAATADRHAIDFEMPVGTPVHAARDGTVIETVGDFVGTGLDPDRDADQANLVRILHDDGTLALYGHLSAGSIAVAPGQRVERGERIADSGNTGFTSGPHLHFVVQRNRAGAVESVPVTFAGAGGAALSLRTGDSPVAH